MIGFEHRSVYNRLMTSDTSSPTAALIIIGNEILSGRTQDANTQFIGTQLARMGITLKQVRVVADVEDEIVEAVNSLRTQVSYVFTTGGIGPTHDDITAASVAKAFGVGLERHGPTEQALTEAYQGRVNAARLKMADLPIGSMPIETHVVAAPGFQMGNVYVMAGVPKIMQAMFDAVAPSLAHGTPVHSKHVDAHMGEGDLAEGLTAIQNDLPDIDLGSYPFYRDGVIGTSIVARGRDMAQIDQAINRVADLMRAAGREPLFGPHGADGG